MLLKELIFKTWFVLLSTLVISLFISTIVNPTVVLAVLIASTLTVLFKAKKGIKEDLDEY
jgi:hypothetical protein